MEEKGYRFKYKGKWGVVKRIPGDFVWEMFDEEPTDYYLMPYKIAMELKNRCWFKDEIELIECGIIPEDQKDMERRNYVIPIKFSKK